ncbi:MAG: hypothetical protein ACW96U_10455 [Candidatus Heimdallarchaeaceae archaeon]|jgi:hypothetical protein
MSAKVFIGSVLVSILILAPATYFLMPILYPGMINDVSNDVTGILLQSEYYVFDSESKIYDNELSFKLMNGTTCLIQTQGNSSLTILFSTVAVMSLNSAWTEKSEYIIDLVIEGVESKAVLHAFHDDGPVHGAYRVITYDITINLDTGILTAGTYNISVFWRSTVDAVGTNSFYIYDPGNDYLRSLWIQEIYQG